ncbi:MAG: hypothetical protein ABFD25_18575 [Clostridiaceae bacterium]
MPPKARITKEQIVGKAFEILKLEGFAGITARRLSKELNCSTQPIYSIFEDMDDLKKELYAKSKVYFEKCVMDIKDKSKPELDFLEIGVAYIKCSKKEQKIFHFICMENNYTMNGVAELVSGAPLPEKQAGIFLNMWLYAHGIACIISNNDVTFNENEIRKLLMNAYKGFSGQNGDEG